MRDISRLQDIAFPLFLMGAGGYVISRCFGYGIGSILRPGAGFWPLLMGILLICCGGALAAGAKRANATEVERMHRREFFIVFSIAAGLLLWGGVAGRLGWLLATFSLTLFLSKLFGLAGIFKPSWLSVLLTAVCYILFGVLFKVDLPPAWPSALF